MRLALTTLGPRASRRARLFLDRKEPARRLGEGDGRRRRRRKDCGMPTKNEERDEEIRQDGADKRRSRRNPTAKVDEGEIERPQDQTDGSQRRGLHRQRSERDAAEGRKSGFSRMMKKVTGEKAKMWGPSIIGFGSYHYKYESGREGDMCIAGFSPRGPATRLLYRRQCSGERRAFSRGSASIRTASRASTSIGSTTSILACWKRSSRSRSPI